MLQELEAELRLRGVSVHTVRAYLRYNRQFLKASGKDAAAVTETDVKGYLSRLLAAGKSVRTVALAKAALRFYYDELQKKGIVSFRTPKMEKKLPVVLTRDEMRQVLAAASTEKSRLILMLLYSSGLRLSEVVQLKKGDVELGERMLWVRKGKGAKDRMTILSNAVVHDLTPYLLNKSANSFVFERRGKALSPRNVQKIVEKTAKKAGISKNVSPHTFRHTFATHLLDAGVDIRKIQELLGHANLQTTQIYTRVSTEELKKVKSPMDLL